MSNTTLALRFAFGPDDQHDSIEAMTRGYVDALLWTTPIPTDDGSDSNGYFLEEYDSDDLTDELVDSIRGTLTEFVASHPLAARMYARRFIDGWNQFGHDFLLTRDGHGAGFWDRGLGELGDYLTALVKPYGESESISVDSQGRVTA